MNGLLHHLIEASARRHGSGQALSFREAVLDYATLAERVAQAADGFAGVGLRRGERLAIYLEKRIETVAAMFGAAAAGGVYVPINPLLKPRQVGYILRDCNVRVLVTSRQRLADLGDELGKCADLRTIILVDGATDAVGDKPVMDWRDAMVARS